MHGFICAALASRSGAGRYIKKVTLMNFTSLAFPEAVLLAFVPKISFCRAQINNLRAAVTVFLHLSAFFAVIGVRDALASTNGAPALERTEVTLLTDLYKGTRTDIRIANDAFAVALFAEPANSRSRLLPAENQVRMMLCHFFLLFCYLFLSKVE